MGLHTRNRDCNGLSESGFAGFEDLLDGKTGLSNLKNNKGCNISTSVIEEVSQFDISQLP